MNSPIADLSYRNYDGPLEPPVTRWQPIARVAILAAFKKKSFWGFSIGSGFWYAIMMIVFYFADALSPRAITGVNQEQLVSKLFQGVKWDEIFLHAFSRGQLWFFLIALLIGVGTISNDNRANALLVYLSKPCTKLDYLIGKWVGIFVPLVIAAAIPTFFFYTYCFLSYRDNGFLHDPWLILKLGLMVLIPAFFHASLSLGISSLFKQGRLAGATYAGIFFFSYFFTVAMGALHGTMAFNGQGASPVVDNAFYMSVDGVQIGLAKHILGTYGTQPFPFLQGFAAEQSARAAIPPPNLALILVLFFGISAGSLLIAWSRVRAVEVVG